LSDRGIEPAGLGRLPTTVPPLKDLQYEQCGYRVPAGFTLDFVALHHDDWALAERDWEDIVALVLDTDAVHEHATGGAAVKQAVEAAAAFLSGEPEWPWCPICKRGTDAKQERADQ
jgi:hypothetical protein